MYNIIIAIITIITSIIVSNYKSLSFLVYKDLKFGVTNGITTILFYLIKLFLLIFIFEIIDFITNIIQYF